MPKWSVHLPRSESAVSSGRAAESDAMIRHWSDRECQAVGGFGATVTKVMKAQDKISVWGTGEEERDILHAEDLNNFVQLALLKQTEKYRLYNCGLGKALPVIEIIKKIIAASGKNLKIEHDLSKPTIKTSLSLDCSLAKKELGWEPQISLDEGILKTIQWWQNNINNETLTLKAA